MMAVYYFYGDYGDPSPQFIFAPHVRFVFNNPSECCMIIPGSYADMKDL